jgi:flavorubredoxin
MKAIVVYESLTGRTARTAQLIAARLQEAGVEVTAVNPVTDIDLQALADADLVIVGAWTDGFIFIGQRPGRQGRLWNLPALSGKRAVVYVTYAIDSGNALEKLQRIVESRGAEVLGGLTIRRDDLAGGAAEFVDRLVAAVARPAD